MSKKVLIVDDSRTIRQQVNFTLTKGGFTGVVLTRNGFVRAGEMVDRARKAGAKGWLVKPFKPEQLVAVVQKLVG